MFFFYLYLGHLLADYIFQPTLLVEWKHRSRWGLFTHALVHFLVTTLLAYIYTANYLSIVLGAFLAATHYFIDIFKVTHDQKHQHTHLAYWNDQFAHFLVIMTTALVISRFPELIKVRLVDWSNLFDAFYFSPVFVTYSCIAIFSTLTIEYSFYRIKQNSSKKKILLSGRHMLKRLFLASLVYIGLLFSLVPSVGFNL